MIDIFWNNQDNQENHDYQGNQDMRLGEFASHPKPLLLFQPHQFYVRPESSSAPQGTAVRALV